MFYFSLLIIYQKWCSNNTNYKAVIYTYCIKYIFSWQTTPLSYYTYVLSLNHYIMSLRNDWIIRVDDYVSISGDESTYEGIVIDTNNGITVLFTDGDVCRYSSSNNLKLLNGRRSLEIGEKIIKVLQKMTDQKSQIDKQRKKIKEYLLKLS